MVPKDGSQGWVAAFMPPGTWKSFFYRLARFAVLVNRAFFVALHRVSVVLSHADVIDMMEDPDVGLDPAADQQIYLFIRKSNGAEINLTLRPFYEDDKLVFRFFKVADTSSNVVYTDKFMFMWVFTQFLILCQAIYCLTIEGMELDIAYRWVWGEDEDEEEEDRNTDLPRVDWKKEGF